MNRNVVVGLVVAALVFGGMASLVMTNNEVLAGNSVPPPSPPFAAFGPDCEIAPVSNEHLFVAASVYEGDTLTNVQLGDQAGLTTMVRIVVASGTKPITILLQSSQAVIFSFEGAVQRVARAIIDPGYRDRVAVAGLPAAQVDILKLARCPAQTIPFEKVNERSRDEVLLTLFGRQPDRIATHYSPNSIAWPDLQPGSSPTSGPERTAETESEKNLLRYFPGGSELLIPSRWCRGPRC